MVQARAMRWARWSSVRSRERARVRREDMFGMDSDSDDGPRALCVTRRDANERAFVSRGCESKAFECLSTRRIARERRDGETDDDR